MDYLSIDALSFEVRQKLNRYRPETLGLASRISGVTPAAISLLLIHLKRMKAKRGCVLEDANSDVSNHPSVSSAVRVE